METRRAKRYRKAHTITDVNTNSTPNYLNTQPSDIQDVILRHLSTRPNHARWPAYIPPQDAVTALQCALAPTARAHLCSLHLHFGYALPPSHRFAQGPQLECAKDGSIFNDLLVEQSPRLHTLTFDMSRLSMYIFEYCTNLRVLALRYFRTETNLDPILAACGAGLRELHLCCETHLSEGLVDAVAAHCTALRSITLFHDTVNVSLLPLWQKIGANLTKVAFQPPRPMKTMRSSPVYRAELAGMAAACPNLTNVELYHGGKNFPSAPLLVALGGQLRRIRFMVKDTCPEPAILDTIVQACPNAVLQLNVSKHAHDVLRIAGARLHTLKLRHNFAVTDEFRDIAATLTGLRELTLCMRPESYEFVRRFFDSAKPNIVKLNVDRVAFGQFHVLCDVLPGKMTTLRDLEFTARQPVYGWHIDKLLLGNKDLKKIWINSKVKDGAKAGVRKAVAAATASVVKRLGESSGVRELVVKNANVKGVLSEVADACVPLRARGIDVIVGDVRYLPTALKLVRKQLQY